MFSVVFEDNFQLLPTRHQEIWKILWHFCTKHRNVFPSHDKLAELAHCSRRTVIKALASFRNFGWLTQMKRCYRSNVYFIHGTLLKKNPKDPKTFLKEGCQNGREGGVLSRESCTQSCTLYSVASNFIATERCKNTTVQPKWASPSHKEQPRVRPDLAHLPFQDKDKLMLQKCFGEKIIGRALESYKTYRYAKQKPIALFWWLCKEAKQYFNKRK